MSNSKTLILFHDTEQKAIEQLDVLLRGNNVRIERIVSYSHTNPPSGYYDQEEHEWVCVIEGEAKLMFEDGIEVQLKRGDSMLLEAHKKHRVSYTSNPCIWLCVFYSASKE